MAVRPFEEQAYQVKRTYVKKFKQNICLISLSLVGVIKTQISTHSPKLAAILAQHQSLQCIAGRGAVHSVAKGQKLNFRSSQTFCKNKPGLFSFIYTVILWLFCHVTLASFSVFPFLVSCHVSHFLSDCRMLSMYAPIWQFVIL